VLVSAAACSQFQQIDVSSWLAGVIQSIMSGRGSRPTGRIDSPGPILVRMRVDAGTQSRDGAPLKRAIVSPDATHAPQILAALPAPLPISEGGWKWRSWLHGRLQRFCGSSGSRFDSDERLVKPKSLGGLCCMSNDVRNPKGHEITGSALVDVSSVLSF